MRHKKTTVTQKTDSD